MKQIVIKFTVAKGIASFMMFKMFGHKYTHASLGLDAKGDEFYSFAFKGFSMERKRTKTPKNWRENYAYNYIEVEDAVYYKLVEQIEYFKKNRKKYKYSNLEVFCAFIGIPYKAKNSYYCSYFVAELLASSGIYTFKKSPSLYLPHYLFNEMKQYSYVEYTCES